MKIYLQFIKAKKKKKQFLEQKRQTKRKYQAKELDLAIKVSILRDKVKDWKNKIK